MRAVAITSLGDFTDLKVREVPDPHPGPGEVRVRVHAAALNPADAKVVRWLLAARFLHAKVDPLIPGYDLSGLVDAVGDGVRDLRVGDAVFGHLPYSSKTRQGTLAELVTIDASQVARKPDGVSHEVAAAAATTGLSALQALRDAASLSKGAHLLVMGASGGVGSLAVGIGKRLGAHVTGVCSTHAVDRVRALGADRVVDRRKQPPLKHDAPFNVVFDTSGQYTYFDCAPLLTEDGIFVTTLPSPSFFLAKLVTLFTSRRCALFVVHSRRADLEQLGRWLAGGLTVPIAEKVAARDAARALQRLEAGGLVGKIAVDVIAGV